MSAARSMARRCLPALTLALALCSPRSALAEVELPPPRVDLALSYYTPIHENRQVHSIFFNAAVGTEIWPLLGLSMYGGLTASRAWGEMYQLGEQFQELHYRTEASGVGPMFLLRLAPLTRAGFSLALEMVLSVLLYDRGFPSGGELYNFSLRFGASVNYEVNEHLCLSLGARWMHVSNGQGLGDHNPSYEGVGFPVGVELVL